MKNNDINISLRTIIPQLIALSQKAGRYAAILFFLLVAGVYSFVLFRINSLSNIQPTSENISSQEKTATVPNIDPRVVKQLETMKDNSVNVQTLFQQARDNPFQE